MEKNRPSLPGLRLAPSSLQTTSWGVMSYVEVTEDSGLLCGVRLSSVERPQPLPAFGSPWSEGTGRPLSRCPVQHIELGSKGLGKRAGLPEEEAAPHCPGGHQGHKQRCGRERAALASDSVERRPARSCPLPVRVLPDADPGLHSGLPGHHPVCLAGLFGLASGPGVVPPSLLSC